MLTVLCFEGRGVGNVNEFFESIIFSAVFVSYECVGIIKFLFKY